MASYDTMAAYLERENNRLAEEDRAVSKRIADEAISKVMGTQNQINTNIDNAIETAYRQRESAPAVAETSKIANNALTDRIVRGYGINRDTIRRNLDNLKAGIKVNQEQNNLKTDKNYDTSDDSLELAIARREADNARVEAQETARQQEGFLEQLNEISKQAGYDYDFDADIFALKQQGYTDKDWQIQYLQEAKRLQKRNAKASSSGGSSETTGKEEKANGGYSESAYVNLRNGLGSYFLSPTALKAGAIRKIEQAYDSGAITEEEVEKLLDEFDLV